MGKIIFMTNVDRRYAMMAKSLRSLQEEGKLSEASRCLKVSDDDKWSRLWEDALSGADLVMVKWMGTSVRTHFWSACRDFMERREIPYHLISDSSTEPQVLFHVKPEAAAEMLLYSRDSGDANYRNLFLYAAAVFSQSTVPYEKPTPLAWAGLWHPRMKEKYMTDLASYEKRFCTPGRPAAGIVFYRDEWIWGDLSYQTKLVEEVEARGMNVIPVFTNGMPSEEAGMPSLREVFSSFFTHDGKPAVDVIINIMKFSLTASSSITVTDLSRLGVPVLQGYSLLVSYKEWKKDPQGMNGMEVSISVSLPEFDGVIHGAPVSTKEIQPDGDVRYVPVPERIAMMAAKAYKWAMLRRKQNKDKKVAVVFHNYPPKNSNIGSAVGLDTIESVRRLLARMKDAGYDVASIPADGDAFIRELTANATNDLEQMTEKQAEEAMRVPEKDYLAFHDTFGKTVKAQMEKDWGKAPGSVMIGDDGALIVPGTMKGHVFVTVQAPRGFGLDPAKIYHDPYVAPTHQYLAFYQWIRDVWKADAVIHVGTHGNLEWLPGKGAGLDRESYPDLALGDLPDIYPYHMTITGEGMQAKRRGAACLIGHFPAPLTDAGTYDELAELEKTMDEYAHVMRTEPERAPLLEEMIRKKAKEANLDGEVAYDEKKPFGEYVSDLHEYLEELKGSEVHMGLHILGQAPEGKRLTEAILQILRLENGEEPSILSLFAEKYGTTPEEITKKAASIYEPIGCTYSELMTKIREECRKTVETLQNEGFSAKGEEAALRLPLNTEGSPLWQGKLRKLLHFTVSLLYPRLRKTQEEMDHIIDALDGKYIEPGPSGSPHTGGAALLPSGRNFYGVDPRCLPTPAAWEIGKILGDEAVERFIAEEGRYPENVGIVLWSGANMRTRGQCIAEFLWLMGIRPVWQKGSLRVKDLEVIPLAELKRPRIDVTGRISGLFRDTLSVAAELMDRAVLMAAALPEREEDNFIRAHIGKDAEALETEGKTKEEAWRTAAYRIFGDAPGTYGAGVSALLEAKNWETIDDIANVYVRWGGHAFGGKTQGAYMPEQFKKRLSSMDVTIKNEDNHETNMLSSDDYNAYHGGMIAAVRSIRGKAPRSYCGDATDRSRPVMRSVQEETKRVFRTESMNPKYIHGMMEHGYKGASDMANMVAHSFQWDATSSVMEDWMYEKYAEKYAFDKDVQQWMRKVNPWALSHIAETLLEANQRGLWNAKDETKKELQKLCLSIEGELEESGDDDD